MHDGTCRESSGKGEKAEVPSYLMDLAECPLALWSSSNACRVQKIISGLRRIAFEPRTFAEHVASVVGVHVIKILE